MNVIPERIIFVSRGITVLWSMKYCQLHWRGPKNNSLGSKAWFIIRPWIRSLRCIIAITFRDFGPAASLNECLTYGQMFYYLFFKINGGGWDRSWYHPNTRLLPTTKWYRLHYKDNQSLDDGRRVNCRNVTWAYLRQWTLSSIILIYWNQQTDLLFDVLDRNSPEGTQDIHEDA